jgi:hypothetical protein
MATDLELHRHPSEVLHLISCLKKKHFVKVPHQWNLRKASIDEGATIRE